MPLDINKILAAMNEAEVKYLLIGGANFMLRHKGAMTYDVDLWVEDSEANLMLIHQALSGLQAEWGSTDDDWGPVADKSPDWLTSQAMFCLMTPWGALDIFRSLLGVEIWSSAWLRSKQEQTAAGIPYRAISDADMLDCQYALPEGQRNRTRVEFLENELKKSQS